MQYVYLLFLLFHPALAWFPKANVERESPIDICPVGYVLEAKGCYKEETTPASSVCPKGYELQNDTCVHNVSAPKECMCPDTYTQQAGGCVRTSESPAEYFCPPEYVFIEKETRCEKTIEVAMETRAHSKNVECELERYCPEGYVREQKATLADVCSKIEVVAKSKVQKSKQETCPVEMYCPEGYTQFDKTCSKIVTTPLASKQVPKKETASLLYYCPDGYLETYPPQGKEGVCEKEEKVMKVEVQKQRTVECGVVDYCPEGYLDTSEGCYMQKSTPPLTRSKSETLACAPPKPVCPEGHVLDKGNVCVKRMETQKFSKERIETHACATETQCPQGTETRVGGEGGLTCVSVDVQPAAIKADKLIQKMVRRGRCLQAIQDPDTVSPFASAVSVPVSYKCVTECPEGWEELLGGKVCQKEETILKSCCPDGYTISADEKTCSREVVSSPVSVCPVGCYEKSAPGKTHAHTLLGHHRKLVGDLPLAAAHKGAHTLVTHAPSSLECVRDETIVEWFCQPGYTSATNDKSEMCTQTHTQPPQWVCEQGCGGDSQKCTKTHTYTEEYCPNGWTYVGGESKTHACQMDLTVPRMKKCQEGCVADTLAPIRCTKEETYTEMHCPAEGGWVEKTVSECARTHTQQQLSKCPEGYVNVSGVCEKTTYHTEQYCPKGTTENKGVCERTATTPPLARCPSGCADVSFDKQEYTPGVLVCEKTVRWEIEVCAGGFVENTNTHMCEKTHTTPELARCPSECQTDVSVSAYHDKFTHKLSPPPIPQCFRVERWTENVCAGGYVETPTHMCQTHTYAPQLHSCPKGTVEKVTAAGVSCLLIEKSEPIYYCPETYTETSNGACEKSIFEPVEYTCPSQYTLSASGVCVTRVSAPVGKQCPEGMQLKGIVCVDYVQPPAQPSIDCDMNEPSCKHHRRLRAQIHA